MPHSWFIVGTDTEVGKTHVACGLLQAALRRGILSAPFKPFESGTETLAPGSSDAERMWSSAGHRGPFPTRVSRYRFARAVAPGVAADELQIPIKLCQLIADARSLRKDYELVIGEGAGGLQVPIGNGKLYSELLEHLQFPVLLVGTAGLGTLNHTLLTAESLRARGLNLLGAVLNQQTPSPLAASNAHQLLYYGVPVLATLSHQPFPHHRPSAQAPPTLSQAEFSALLDRLLAH